MKKLNPLAFLLKKKEAHRNKESKDHYVFNKFENTKKGIPTILIEREYI